MQDAQTVQDTLLGMWRDVLKSDDVDVYDSFFDLGGHSLLAMRLLARIEKQLGVTVEFHELFDALSVAEMTELVMEKRAAAA